MSAPDISAFGQMMAGLLPEPPARIAVAVSGGADSMALAVLAQGWAKAYGVALHAITVDHQLRPESTAEAERVASWLQARGIAHTILTWHHDNLPQANLQAAARDARYRLMTMWCTTHNVQHLLLGHHLDDQAETFLIRLQRGSGVDGLAAMKPVTTRHGLTLLRPLLTIPKDELQDILRGIGQEWIEDPGNHNTDHTRVRMRQLLAEQGIDSYALAATATRMARARDFLEQETARAIATCVTFHTEGYITLDTAVFNALHEEIGLRVLADCIRAMNGQVYRPRFGELHSLHTGLGSPRTLAGCRFMPQNGGLRIQREQVAIAPARPYSLMKKAYGMAASITAAARAARKAVSPRWNPLAGRMCCNMHRKWPIPSPCRKPCCTPCPRCGTLKSRYSSPISVTSRIVPRQHGWIYRLSAGGMGVDHPALLGYT